MKLQMELSPMLSTKDKIPKIITPQKHLQILETPAAEDAEGLREQLESCRAALRLQTSRSRQLVAAYNTKLREKDIAFKNAEKEFDNRLASIIRALMALEANMKREQRIIKEQLIEKDNIILEQQKIISTFLNNKNESISSCPSSQNSSLTSTSSENNSITLTQTLSVYQEKLTIQSNPNPQQTSSQYLNNNENNDDNTKKLLLKRPEKPPKPPKPINTPYKPILKSSSRQLPPTAIFNNNNKDIHTKSLPELSYAQQRAKRTANDVCLLLAPARIATSTCHLHPTTPEIIPSSQQKHEEHQETLENKVVSPHRVSRMVQRFDNHNKRSSSCSALPSLRLSEHREEIKPLSDGECEQSNIENIPADPELYSLSSDCSDKYQNVDTLRGNFVEFHLDSDNSEENEDDIISRKEGDGAEILKQVINNKQTSYEGFLEATGLSQKSILTPSRMSQVSNNSHRSVLKPRDVKYRSKANRCFNTGTVKYWSGPYL